MNLSVRHILFIGCDTKDCVFLRDFIANKNNLNTCKFINKNNFMKLYLKENPLLVLDPVPDFILLEAATDLELSLEIIRKIKIMYKTLPVIVLSGTPTNGEINKIYDSCANCLVTSSEDESRITAKMEGIYDFWLNVVELPSVGMA